MKIVVIGGTGLIGSKAIPILQAAGHEALAAAPNTGVDTITGEGLDAALAGADVVIDLANSRSFEPASILDFFTTHEKNLLAAEARAGVKHHVALSVVGADRSPANGYFLAKVAQEEAIKASGLPYTIIRSTQFLEFLSANRRRGGKRRRDPYRDRPVSADRRGRCRRDRRRRHTVRAAQGHGRDRGSRTGAFQRNHASYLAEIGDPRPVHADAPAQYFGGEVERLSLVPLGDARLGQISLSEWTRQQLAK